MQRERVVSTIYKIANAESRINNIQNHPNCLYDLDNFTQFPRILQAITEVRIYSVLR